MTMYKKGYIYLSTKKTTTLVVCVGVLLLFTVNLEIFIVDKF